MSAASPGSGSPQGALTLAERCRDLGLPVWRWEGSDASAIEPSGWREGGRWLRAPKLLQTIETARSAWPRLGAAPPAPLGRGMWLIPIEEAHFARTRCLTAALAIAPDALDGEEFESICESARLEPEAARRALSPLARWREGDVESLRQILAWMHEDLAHVAQERHTIDGFSRQLVESYEQISLLYRVADSMNGGGDAREVVSLACELLHSTLEFGWIAARFASFPSLGRTLANELVFAGELPCSHTRYDKLAGDMLATITAGQEPAVVEPHQIALAQLVEAEVFVNPLVRRDQVAGVLLAGNKHGDDPEISSGDMQLISATADYLSAFIHNVAMYNEQQTTFLGIVKALSASIDAKDRYTRGHSERVAHLAWQLAVGHGMSEEQADRVRLGGLLHDVGKIGVPESVLLKQGRLTDEEFAAIKLHPTIGYNILREIEPLEDVLPGVLHHHERWDGNGYPQALRGEAIPLIARVLAVADTFDAMSSNRSYRQALPRQRVLDEIASNAGTQFEPALAKRFVKLDLSEYDRMARRHEAKERAAA